MESWYWVSANFDFRMSWMGVLRWENNRRRSISIHEQNQIILIALWKTGQVLWDALKTWSDSTNQGCNNNAMLWQETRSCSTHNAGAKSWRHWKLISKANNGSWYCHSYPWTDRTLWENESRLHLNQGIIRRWENGNWFKFSRRTKATRE